MFYQPDPITWPNSWWYGVKTRPTFFMTLLILYSMWQKFCTPSLKINHAKKKKLHVFLLHATENTVHVLQAVVNEWIISRGLSSLCFPYFSMCDFYLWQYLNTIYVTRAHCRPCKFKFIMFSRSKLSVCLRICYTNMKYTLTFKDTTFSSVYV